MNLEINDVLMLHFQFKKWVKVSKTIKDKHLVEFNRTEKIVKKFKRKLLALHCSDGNVVYYEQQKRRYESLITMYESNLKYDRFKLKSAINALKANSNAYCRLRDVKKGRSKKTAQQIVDMFYKDLAVKI